MVCAACHYSCYQCYSSNYNDGCLECSANDNRSFAQGKCVCNVGFYDDGSSTDC